MLLVTFKSAAVGRLPVETRITHEPINVNTHAQPNYFNCALFQHDTQVDMIASI